MNELFLVVVLFFILLIAIGSMYDIKRRELEWEEKKFKMDWVKR